MCVCVYVCMRMRMRVRVRVCVLRYMIRYGKDSKIYIGMAETEFKTRFNDHKLSFKHKKHANKTILSKYIIQNKREHQVEWSIIKRAKPYSSGKKTCSLCSAEKMAILSAIRNTYTE